MSVQYGRLNLDGKPADIQEMDRIRRLLAPYGPDGESCYGKHNLAVIYRAFYTTQEARKEKQPFILASGAVMTWDGRLDNREELLLRLGHVVADNEADASIVAGTLDRWGIQSLGSLIGDWALSICDPNAKSVLLAKDPIGTRHLYYSIDGARITWSTVLDPLVLSSQDAPLSEEYIAGFLAFFPATHLTPYAGVHSVEPSTVVQICAGSRIVHKYWDFDPSKQILLRTDADYEEEFRDVLAQAVRRRLRSDRTVLSELSGGMDSSAVVCMADRIMAREVVQAPRLDTVSYYDDTEPNWNERPYFRKVEEARGRVGRHIDVAGHENVFAEYAQDQFVAAPSCATRSGRANTQFVECLTERHSRVLLSGIGGDEATGGLPTPIPELQDLIARAQFKTLVRQLKSWALNKRRPWFHLFMEATRGFFPAVPNHKAQRGTAPWLDPGFVARNKEALNGYPTRLRLLGPRPTFQHNLSTLEGLRRQMEFEPLPSHPVFEKRYPLLDRDLLEFMYAIPRSQLVRPGQRRSLMRRALGGIVPEEVLNRRRKAFVTRGPVAALGANPQLLGDLTQEMLTASFGIVSHAVFAESIENARRGQEVQIVTMMRTLALESWLRHMKRWKVGGIGSTECLQLV
jgi:asparagine synthase (glutamine-hydrolysing)